MNEHFKENIGKCINVNLLPESNIIHILKGPQIESFSEEAIKTSKSSIYNNGTIRSHGLSLGR